MYLIIPTQPEEYKICTYPGVASNRYYVSNYGNIKNKSGYIMQIGETGRYKRAHLRFEDGSSHHVSIHRLVAWEFCDGYNESTNAVMVNHLDGNTYNNYYENLVWCSQSENERHKYDHLGYKHPGPKAMYGKDHPRTKYDESTIHKICQLLADKNTILDVMHHFGYKGQKDNKTLYNLIYDIKNKRVWQHISKNYDI